MIKTVAKLQNKIEELLIEENLDELGITWECSQMDGDHDEQVIIVRLGEEY